MSDSITKHEDKLQDELECARRMYAGQGSVYCAATKKSFDFTKVSPEDIIKGLHCGIRARAVLKYEGVPDICYLRSFEGNFAELPLRTEEETQQWVRDSFNPTPDPYPNMKVSVEDQDVVLRNEGKEISRMSLTDAPTEFEAFVTDYCNDLRDLLIEKNKSYGNSAIEPIRIFSTSDSEEQIRVRIDDKLSRIKSGSTTYDEDTIQDLQGYLILLQYKNKLKANGE